MNPELEHYLNARFEKFRREELVPIQLSLARVEGTVTTFKEQQASNHAENSHKLDGLQETVNRYLGGVEEREESSDKRHHVLREWLKVILAGVSLTGIIKLITDWVKSWHK
jgi:hypothetical protein